jgi:sporulation protein YlmC with PRC-barrel domain
MGFNRPTWMPGLTRNPIAASREKQIARLREQRQDHAREKLAARELEGSLISLAALLGSDVKDSAGSTVGRLRDIVVRWTKGGSYPPVTGIVVANGSSDVFIGLGGSKPRPHPFACAHRRRMPLRSSAIPRTSRSPTTYSTAR